MSALHTLARIARSKAEEIERGLAVLDARRMALETALAGHDRAVEGERARAGETMEGMIAYGAYVQAALHQRRRLAADLDAANNEVDALREALRDAFVELKKIETLIEQAAAREAVEEGRREQAQMDDLAANMARNRS